MTDIFKIEINQFYTEAKLRSANTDENTTKSSSIKCNTKKKINKPRSSKNSASSRIRTHDLLRSRDYMNLTH